MSEMVAAPYFNRKGEPIDLVAWGRLHEDADYKAVAQHWVRGWMVSTVWLGIDHNFTRSGPPVIFETMIFPPGDAAPEGEGIFSEQYCARYCTEEAAHAGHDQALSYLREKLGDDSLADIVGPLVEGSSYSEWDGSIEP
jgi:hypothetical protein